MWFQKTEMQQRQLQSFQSHLDEACNALLPWQDTIDLHPLEALRDGFRQKSQDFFRQDRKLNLAVVGQLKAGKSSFLNTLLFDGLDVLPQDATPKTATVTKIEYSEKNRLEVEYYTPEEWQVLEEYARSPAHTPHNKEARELVGLAVDFGIDVPLYLRKGCERFEFAEYAQLTAALQPFVGGDGGLAPITKSVTIGVHAPELAGVSVVDTPGLNDPIRSRSQQTRAFLEQCDNLFFLSRSSYFLDRNDVEMLTAWIPQKGIRSLVLVASQFDSALMDTLYDYDSLEDAIGETKVLLRRHSAKSLDAALAKMRLAGTSPHILSVAQQARRPVFVSVMAHRLSKQSPQQDSPKEALVRKALSYHGAVSQDTLGEIGNYAEVQTLFHQMLEQKDETLSSKAAGFVVAAQSDWNGHLDTVQTQIKQARQQLQDVEKPALLEESRQLSQQMNLARHGIINAFQSYLQPLDDKITRGVLALQRASLLYSTPVEKRDVQLHNAVRVVSESKLYLPWTWGKRRREYEITQTEHSYMDVVDVAQQLQMMTEVSKQVMLGTFMSFRNTAYLENMLCMAVQDISPLSQSEIRAAAGAAVKRLEITLPQQTCLQAVKALEEQFPQRTKTTAEQDKLCAANAQAVAGLSEEACHMLDKTAQLLRENARRANEAFTEKTLEALSAHMSATVQKLQTLQAQISTYDELLEVLYRLRR